jgi:hypothetical protein
LRNPQQLLTMQENDRCAPRVAWRLTRGATKLPIQHTYDLAAARAALQALGSTHTRGQLAIRGQ